MALGLKLRGILIAESYPVRLTVFLPVAVAAVTRPLVGFFCLAEFAPEGGAITARIQYPITVGIEWLIPGRALTGRLLQVHNGKRNTIRKSGAIEVISQVPARQASPNGQWLHVG